MTPKIRKFAFRAALILVVLLGVVRWWNTRPLPGPMGEVIAPGEDVEIAKLVAASMALADKDHDIRKREVPQDDNYRRDVHSKSPGCVQATFTVLDNVPAQYRYGLFAQPGKYCSWVRFSNGNHQMKADYQVDVRGMAIKVTGVTVARFGPKLLNSEENDDTQDFVLMNSPTYFFRDLKQYAVFSGLLTRSSGFWGDVWPFFNYSWNPLRWNLRAFLGAGKAQTTAPPSPLHAQYYSASAYRLGSEHYAKYTAKPCRPEADKPKGPGAITRTLAGPLTGPISLLADEHDFLSRNLADILKKDSWCFDFMVQLQAPGKNMPVEDPSIEWSEKDSPFVPVARIDMPAPQDIDPPTVVPDAQHPRQRFCEDLSYNPWHSLREHEPVGVFNRLRRVVYQEGARYRRERNHASTAKEPKGWCLDLTGLTCTPEQMSCSGPPASVK